MPGKHTKQVKQSTFDAIVREAINDFGLSAEEAVVEAREQLKAAGVTDFSNLVDPSVIAAACEESDHEGVVLPRQIHDALDQVDVEALIPLLVQLAGGGSELTAVAGANGALPVIIDALQLAGDHLRNDGNIVLVKPVCEALVALCKSNEPNRSTFVTSTPNDGVEMLKAIFEHLASLEMEDREREMCIENVLKAMETVQRRCESVKQRFAKGQLLALLLSLLENKASHLGGQVVADSSLRVLLGACAVLKQFLSADDSTVMVSETFNRARVLAGGGSVTETGLIPLRDKPYLQDVLLLIVNAVQNSTVIQQQKQTSILMECITLARLLAISNENCAALTALGFDQLAISLIQQRSTELQLVLPCLTLLRNLAGRDECKQVLFSKMGSVRDTALLYVKSSHVVVEHFCSLVAAMCLRRADIARWFSANDVFKVVLEGMKHFEKKPNVQRMGCLAIRNACSRDEDVRNALQSGGVAEEVVRKAWQSFPRECDEVAYNALRDLDVLSRDELRRDERYTMPEGFYSRPISGNGIGPEDDCRVWSGKSLRDKK